MTVAAAMAAGVEAEEATAATIAVDHPALALQEVSFSLPLLLRGMTTTKATTAVAATTGTVMDMMPRDLAVVGVTVLGIVMAQDRAGIVTAAEEGTAVIATVMDPIRTRLAETVTATTAVLVSGTKEQPSPQQQQADHVMSPNRRGRIPARRFAWNVLRASASRAPSSSATLPCV